uniref:Uncharacterized protein n=1 Tax=Medicago truncatula TaxID=3880 RepID=B7FN34_MEDTR|nr:unknown [Medicago truncatula]AFK36690.1 unknown [Medicago truncatula]
MRAFLRISATTQCLRLLRGLEESNRTRSPMLQRLFSSCAINLEVRLIYRLNILWWNNLSTATTTDFCILFETTIPTTSFIFSAIPIPTNPELNSENGEGERESQSK